MKPLPVAVALLLAVLPASAAHAELRISAWMVVVGDASDKAAAEASAHELCINPALSHLCRERLEGQAFGPGIGVYDAAEWPGIADGSWFVGAGLFRERSAALAMAVKVETAGAAARLARVTKVPRVKLWANDVADRWRILAMQTPAGYGLTVYLSRVGSSDSVIAQGDADAIEPVGQPSLDGPFFMAIGGKLQGLDPASGDPVEVPAASSEETRAMQAAAMAHAETDTPGDIAWALPFAAKIIFPAADDPDHARVLQLRLRSVGWTVTRDELRARPQQP